MARLAAVLLALVLATGAARAEEVALSPAELRGLAVQAVQTGHPEEALRLSDGLLLRDPEDVGALVVRARAARDLGDMATARRAAAAAWRAAGTPGQRYAAAKVRAQVLATAGNRTAAQLWLRRAAQNAPSELHRATAERDYRYVRARNRLGVQLSFSVAPVSNLNNGSRHEEGTYELPVFGVQDLQLSGEAQALSGTEFRRGVALSYRLAGQGRRRTDIHLLTSQRRYRLSEDAQDKAPEAEGADYAYDVAQAVLARTGETGGPRTPFRLSAGLGRSWYGGDVYTQYADLGAAQYWALGPGTVLSASVGLRRQEALSDRTGDADSRRVALGLRAPIGRHRVSLELSGQDSISERANLDYTGRGIALGLDLGRPVLGADLAFGLSATRRTYAEGPVSGAGRQDTEKTAEITAVLSPLDLYGFVPEVTLSARRTDSDYGQYDAEEIGLRLGLRSAF